MKLDDTVNLNSGDIFAVILEITNPSYEYPVAIEEKIEGYSDNSIIFDGESYFYTENKWVDGSSLTTLNNNVIVHTPANACIKAFTTCNEEAKIIFENPVGKSINGISVNSSPENLTVSLKDIYAKNPVLTENDYTGRKISQIVVDNDGNNLSEGTDIELYLIYTEDFEKEKIGKVSEYGLRQIPNEINPLYPSGFIPSIFEYIPYPDGYIYPSYLCVTSVDKNGKITINADGMQPFLLDPLFTSKNQIKLPLGHFDVIYAVSADVQTISGALRSIEITSIDVSDISDISDKQKIFINTSRSGCNSEFLTSIACVLLALNILFKSKKILSALR